MRVARRRGQWSVSVAALLALVGCGARGATGTVALEGAGGRGAERSQPAPPMTSASKTPSRISTDSDAAGEATRSVGPDASDPSRSDGGHVPWDGSVEGAEKEDALGRPSREALCTGATGDTVQVGVWSRPGSVNVLVTDTHADQIFTESAEGWQTTYQSSESGPIERLRGFPNGLLLKFGTFPCAIQIIDGTLARCSAATSAITDVFAVDDTLAYALERDRILVYRGADWVQEGPAIYLQGGAAHAIWAAPGLVIVAADGGVWAGSTPEALEPIPKTPFGAYLSVWAFGPADVWAGRRDGTLLHYDGMMWTEQWKSSQDCVSGIRGIWGTNGEVFFRTDTELGHGSIGHVRRVRDWGCDSGVTVTDIWGTSSSEVFMTLVDSKLRASRCGEPSLFGFDGTNLQQL